MVKLSTKQQGTRNNYMYMYMHVAPLTIIRTHGYNMHGGGLQNVEMKKLRIIQARNALA